MNLRPVIDYEGYYEISDEGRLFSVERTIEIHDKIHNRKYTKQFKRRELSPSPDHRGYLCVRLQKAGIGTFASIHRLVARAFIPNPKPESFHCINHIDGNKTNNYISNLEWSNHRDNAVHAVRMGLIKYATGEKHPKTKISDADRERIPKLYSCGMTQVELATIFSVSQPSIGLIIRKALGIPKRPRGQYA